MKYLVLATATAVMLSGFAIAQSCVAKQDAQDAGAASVAGGPQKTRTMMKMAMGPVSAPIRPGGTGNGPGGSTSKCTPPSDWCPKIHRRAKHRHRHSS